jgi:CheY-like chemotaxis protein
VALYVDAGRITQVLVNVLNNASRYSPDGSHVRLTAAVDLPVTTSVGSNTLLITVEDEGYGISAEELPYVFDIFNQRGSRSPSSEAGLGIGLAMVKYLVEAHGGSVSIDSGELRTGTTVTIRLPVTVQPDSPGFESDETYLHAPPRRILLVDDDKDTVDSLGLLLGLDGHIVRTASSATEALAALQNFSPDVALIDLHMPEIDGYTLAAELRSRRVLGQLTLVALTGDVSPGDRETALPEGFEYHLAKPVNMQKLASILAMV